jgi:hypothetical protein
MKIITMNTFEENNKNILKNTMRNGNISFISFTSLVNNYIADNT